MNILKIFLSKVLNNSGKKAFYAVVRCSECGEEVKVRINHSSDFQVEYSAPNPNHYYSIKKEIIGRNCYNLMGLNLGLTRNVRVLFSDVKGCEFIKFGRE